MRMSSRNKKETVVFVTNVGVYINMNLDQEFITKAKNVMKHIIEKKIFVRPKDEIGIILTGVEFGVNALDLDNVEDYCKIEIPTFDMVKKVLEIQASTSCFTNWVDGVRAAVDLIERQSEESARTTIILITDCYDTDQLDENTIYDLSNTIVDREFPFLSLGSKELKNLPEADLNDSEKRLLNFCNEVLGEYLPFSDVLPKLEFYGTAKTSPMAWKCNLDIGEIRIPTATYLQVVENNPTSGKWDKVSINVNPDGSIEVCPVNKNTALVDRFREEHNTEETVRGYMYGRKFVPLSDQDKKVIKYSPGAKSLKLYGFTREKNISIEHRCGVKTNIILPIEGCEKQFFSLVKGMSELRCVGLVRRAYNENSTPVMYALYPQISDDGFKPWCLIMHELAYSEERAIVEPRSYEIILQSLKQEQLNSVDNLLDNMMLGNSVIPEDIEKLYEPGKVSSPDIQHTWNVLAHRALNPDAVLPEPSMSVLKLILPPEWINETEIADNIIDIVHLFDLNKEPEYVPVDNISTQKTQANTLKPSTNTPDENLPPQMDVDLDALFDD